MVALVSNQHRLLDLSQVGNLLHRYLALSYRPPPLFVGKVKAIVPTMKKPFDVCIEGFDLLKSRGDRIRTYDLLVPNQSR